MLSVLDLAAQNALKPETQDEALATYASKLTREDGVIDWSKPAAHIERQLRALHPWPGCTFTLNGEVIKLLAASIVPTFAFPAGTLINDDFTVACGEQALRLDKVQRAGKSATDGASLLRGLRLAIGAKL